MSSTHDNSRDAAVVRAPNRDAPQQEGSAKLAHELSNLLDGSLRHLGLAIRGLDESGAEDEQVLQRLAAVRDAMNQMGGLLRKWMHAPAPRPDLFEQRWSMRQTIEHAIRLLTPAAEARGIAIVVELAEQTEHLPAGPVYPVVANALRNSIEAFDHESVLQRPDKQIIVSVAAGPDGVELSISDNGPGLDPILLDETGAFQFGATTKPGGHGLGLTLCREITESLGGTLNLANRPSHGTVLTLRYPPSAMTCTHEDSTPQARG